MTTRIPPAHLLGAQQHYLVKRGVTRRLHNRRLSMAVTPEGAYQLHIAKALELEEAAELRERGTGTRWMTASCGTGCGTRWQRVRRKRLASLSFG